MATSATNEETGEYEEDFTPKTANRKISKTMIIAAAIVILLAGLGIAGYFIYEGSFYYQTDNAKVDTAIYQLTANASGQLITMNVSQGDEVKAGQMLARVELWPIHSVTRRRHGDRSRYAKRRLCYRSGCRIDCSQDIGYVYHGERRRNEYSKNTSWGRAFQSIWMHTAGVLMVM